MEFKGCPKYKECNCNNLWVIRCNRCEYYKGYKRGYAVAKAKYAPKVDNPAIPNKIKSQSL